MRMCGIAAGELSTLGDCESTGVVSADSNLYSVAMIDKLGASPGSDITSARACEWVGTPVNKLELLLAVDAVDVLLDVIGSTADLYQNSERVDALSVLLDILYVHVTNSCFPPHLLYALLPPLKCLFPFSYSTPYLSLTNYASYPMCCCCSLPGGW